MTPGEFSARKILLAAYVGKRNSMAFRNHNEELAGKILNALELLSIKSEDKVYEIISSAIQEERAIRLITKEKPIKEKGGFSTAICKFIKEEQFKKLLTLPVPSLSTDHEKLIKGMMVLQNYIDNWDPLANNKDVAQEIVMRLKRLDKKTEKEIYQVILEVLEQFILSGIKKPEIFKSGRGFVEQLVKAFSFIKESELFAYSTQFDH